VARESVPEAPLAAVQADDLGVRERGLEEPRAWEANVPFSADLQVHLGYTVAEHLVVLAA
jgi:hypothetical protein